MKTPSLDNAIQMYQKSRVNSSVMTSVTRAIRAFFGGYKVSFTAPEQPQTRTASVNDSGQQKSNQPLAERKVSSSVIPEGDLSTKPNVTDADDPQEPEVFEDSQSSAVSQKKVNPFQKELQENVVKSYNRRQSNPASDGGNGSQE